MSLKDEERDALIGLYLTKAKRRWKTHVITGSKNDGMLQLIDSIMLCSMQLQLCSLVMEYPFILTAA